MTGLFSVEDEIDFSDDEGLFKVNLSEKENKDSLCNISIIATSSSNSKEYKASKLNESIQISTFQNRNTLSSTTSVQQSTDNTRKKFVFRNATTTPFNEAITSNSLLKKESHVTSRNQIFDNFLTDDDDDEFLSQIDMPIGDAVLTQKNENKVNSKNVAFENKFIPPKQGGYTNNSFNIKQIENDRSLRNSKTKIPGLNCIDRNLNVKTPIFPKETSIDAISSPLFIARSKTASTNRGGANLASEGLVTPGRKDKQIICTLKRKSVDEQILSSKQNPLRQRKFPGPAGILPQIKTVEQLNVLKSPDISKEKRTLTPLTPKTPVDPFINLSQDDEFSSSQTWQEISNYIQQYFPGELVTTIATIINKATANELVHGKVELCNALIKSFSISGSGGKVILKDISGEIYGTIHKNVLEEFEAYLKQGTGIILKGVSVFSPSSKKHYINITPSNIVQFFPSTMNDTLNQTQLTQTSQVDDNNDTTNISKHPKQAISTRSHQSAEQNKFMISHENLFETTSLDLDNFFSDDITV